MLRRTLLAAAVAASALPASASAATISTSSTEIVYQAAAGDLVEMQVYGAFDMDLSDSAVFFNPNPGNPTDPTTSDANCVSRPAGASSCRTRARVRLQLAERDDVVNVGAANDLVEFHGGAGADRVFSTGSKLEAFGDGGNDWLQGGPGVDKLDGGTGDDLLDPSGGGDQVNGGSGFDTVRTSGGTTGVIVTLDDVANDGRPDDNQNIRSDVEKVVGGDGDDELEGNPSANTLSGDDGADTLTGNGGADTLQGDAGNDMLQARDGIADQVDCGPGTADTAVVDPLDAVLSNCETVQYADDDGDGVTAQLDCDDHNAAARPGATDVPGNGVDEDCSGADTPAPPAPVVDADGDGVVAAQDCNDSSAAIRPGAVDIPGNGVDENCDLLDALFPLVDSPVASKWGIARRYTLVISLVVKRVPAGGAVAVRCNGRGCPFKRRAAKLKGRRARLTKLFDGHKLRPGAVIEIRITAPGMVGKVVRYRVRKRKLPRSSGLCLAPGAPRPGACP